MRFSNQRDEDVSINLAPLIDVVFLLLILFMVSTTFSKESQLRIHLPEASITDRPMSSELVVQISSHGEYAVQKFGDEIAHSLVNRAPDTLWRALREAKEDQDDPLLIIRADRAAPHEAVVKVLDAARRVGISDITFATFQEGTN